TWGGGLVDMVRCEIILDVMEREGLVENAAEIGAYFLAGLEALGSRSSGVSNVRGRGLMCAFDCVDEAARDRLVAESFQSGVLILSAGERSVRFRPPLTLTRDEVDFGLERLEHALSRSA
ncbi:MAG: aminotransferase class III-fold pyridoxal phosphate-dependent enzyme, partial [Planctomycetota bacterium]